MKNTKKLSAALLVVVMLISMLSCMVVPTASAAPGSTLGEPISIDTNVSAGSGIAVSGKALPNDILVVYSGWAGRNGTVSIKLGGTVYSATMGTNAFAEIAQAAAVANAGNTIYVAAGTYSTQIDVKVSGLKIYGPYAGVSPNAPFNGSAKNLEIANPARPAAASASADTKDEAVFTGRISIPKEGPHTEVNGLYFSGASCDFYNQSGALRYGTYVRNCIVNVTTATFFNMDRGLNANFVFEDNRVLNGKTLTTMGGVMDIRYSRNYFNLSNVTARPSSFASGAMGTACIVEDNYYAECNGAIAYDRTGVYQITQYSFIVRNNYVAKCGPNFSFVTNRYFVTNSLPSINMQITGNTILGVDEFRPVLDFPYVASQGVGDYRYMVNFNNNIVDLPQSGTFINSGMNGVLNCAYNYFVNGVSANQVTKHPEAVLILNPSYLDADMTILSGDARITAVNLNYPSSIDQENLVVNIDMSNTTYPTVNMGAALTISDGCTWELYEDETLTKKIADKILYFDGVETKRYAAIYTADGILSNIYTIRIEREYGSESEIVDILIDNASVPAPEILGTAYKYDVPTDVAFLDYEIKTSSGATYTLYSDSACTTELKADTNYIPYGGYTVYVWVKSEDKTSNSKYSITFNRDRSELYDPCVVDITAPESGSAIIRPDRMDPSKLWMTYTPDAFLKKVNFDFETTPGATWKLYKDSAKNTLLSSSAAKKEIALNPGMTTLYVEVTDATNTNLITFVIQNQTLSSDATITGVVGFAATIVDNKIFVGGFGENFMANFETNNPYAVCKVYADAAKKYPVEYTSTPVVDPVTNRTVDNRTFNLDINLPGKSVYYVECIAEDGTVNSYTMTITKNVAAIEFKDIAKDAWYYSYVTEAANAGIMQGDNNQNFNPNKATTRQEMAIVAARLLGYNNAAFDGVKLNMKDEASIDSWALGAVKVCYANGIMKGNAESNGVYFMPKASITRQEVMIMFARMFNLSGSYDLSVFSDASSVASWAKAEVEATVASGLVQGSDDGRLNPNSPITRAELAALIARAV